MVETSYNMMFGIVSLLIVSVFGGGCLVWLICPTPVICLPYYLKFLTLFVVELFHQPTLMHNSLFINKCMLQYYPRHVRALTCPSSGGQIVFTQHLVSSLSVNGCTVHRLRAES